MWLLAQLLENTPSPVPSREWMCLHNSIPLAAMHANPSFSACRFTVNIPRIATFNTSAKPLTVMTD